MTWIPLSEALHTMPLYSEDQKREKEAQSSDRFKFAVVQATANLAYFVPQSSEEPRHTACVGASRNFSARGLAHSTLHILSSWGAAFKRWRDIFSLTYYCGMDAVNGMKNLDSQSKKHEVTTNVFKKQDGLHLPSSSQKVCSHINLEDATIYSTQAHIDVLITEEWAKFQLDHPHNKEPVNQTTGMRQFRSYSARGLGAPSLHIFHICTAADAEIRAEPAALGTWQLQIGRGNSGYLEAAKSTNYRSPWPKRKRLTSAPLWPTGDKGAAPTPQTLSVRKKFKGRLRDQHRRR